MTRYRSTGNALLHSAPVPDGYAAEEQRRAALAIAARARDAQDLRALLVMLGLLTEA